MTMINDDRMVPPEFVRHAQARRPATPPDQRLADLLRHIKEAPPPTPKVGVDAAQNMRNAYSTVVADIRRVAQDHVDRAVALQQESESFCAIVEQAGMRLCEKIEAEAVRGYQVSTIMREVRAALVEPAPAPAVAGEEG